MATCLEHDDCRCTLTSALHAEENPNQTSLIKKLTTHIVPTRIVHMQVESIPTLVILETTTGKVVTTEGCHAVRSDPSGARFPWTPPSLLNLAQGTVTNAKGNMSDFATIAQGKVTGLYFSAKWCPPCRAFTPQLAEFYNSKRGTTDEFEIVFVSRYAACAQAVLAAPAELACLIWAVHNSVFCSPMPCSPIPWHTLRALP
jgi:thiol-disulfide isomerase/thioredoxin